MLVKFAQCRKYLLVKSKSYRQDGVLECQKVMKAFLVVDIGERRSIRARIYRSENILHSLCRYSNHLEMLFPVPLFRQLFFFTLFSYPIKRSSRTKMKRLCWDSLKSLFDNVIHNSILLCRIFQVAHYFIPAVSHYLLSYFQNKTAQWFRYLNNILRLKIFEPNDL